MAAEARFHMGSRTATASTSTMRPMTMERIGSMAALSFSMAYSTSRS